MKLFKFTYEEKHDDVEELHDMAIIANNAEMALAKANEYIKDIWSDISNMEDGETEDDVIRADNGGFWLRGDTYFVKVLVHTVQETTEEEYKQELFDAHVIR